MASVSSALQRIKQDLSRFLPDQCILAACRNAGHCWRYCSLGPVQTLHLFILQVLNFNTAMTHLRHLSKTAVQAPAYCKARMRFPLAALQALLVESAAAMHNQCRSAQQLWCGLRAYLVDGSSTIVPDTPSSQQAFGQPKGQKIGCGFPVPKVLGLFDAFSGLLLQVLGFPLFTHEQSKVWMLHPLLGAGDLLVGDRGFCSYVHLAMLRMRQVHGLFRIHQRTHVNFRPHRRHRRKYSRGKRVSGKPMPKSKPMPKTRFIRRLGRHDQIVEYHKPLSPPGWMDKEQFLLLPQSMHLRELRFTLPCRGQRTKVVTILTTLLDETLYPKQKIAELYGVRWRVETHFAQLKTTLKMRKLKSKTPDGVLKELTVYALVYNLIHLLMLKAAQTQRVLPHRISFIDTLRWLLSAQPGEPLPPLLVIPDRPDRHEPRVVKDRQDTYWRMTRPRAVLRKELKRREVRA